MPTRKCRDNEVQNPKTDRCILINGVTYNNVFKDRIKINKGIRKKPKLTKKKNPQENAFKVRMKLNEELKKKPKLTKKGSPHDNIYRARMKVNQNILKKANKTEKTLLNLITYPIKYKKCPEGKVLNTHTNRCIAIGSALYKTALKNGWLHFENAEDQKQKLPFQEPKPKKQTKKKNLTKDCKNKTTFMMFEEVKDLDEDDLFIIPFTNYCFSAEELVAYISSEAYNNKNPHDVSKILFFRDDLEDTFLKKHPKVLEAVQKYFKMKDDVEKKKALVYLKTIDVLHEVCNTGRICYYNNITSWDKDDSSTFDRSIEALSNISNMLTNKLSKTEKTAYAKVIQIVDDANKGNLCIHGAGSKLMIFALEMFSKLPDVYYDTYKTNLSIEKTYINKKEFYYIVSREHRFTPDPANSWTTETLQGWLRKIGISDSLEKDLSKYYDNNCEYPAYMVTDDALDEWGELFEWRKIRLGDKFNCFDILYLIKSITNNLNVAKNNNPYPTYPTNPFTQKIFTKQQLRHLKHMCDDNFILLNNPLKIFLNNPELWVSSVDGRWRDRLLDKLEDEKLRFVRKNNIIDGELQCNGAWHLDTTPTSDIERTINRYLNSADPQYIDQLRRLPNEVINDAYYFTVSDVKLKEIKEVKNIDRYIE